jgi:hypothetical protein
MAVVHRRSYSVHSEVARPVVACHDGIPAHADDIEGWWLSEWGSASGEGEPDGRG